ncbi:ribonuclease H-like domain-containing protein [Tanacetum coccineum]
MRQTRPSILNELDVNNAFLHGDLSETVYMHQPPGFRDSAHPDYGIDSAHLLLYVDDIVLTASFEGLLQQIIGSLHQEFAMTDLGPLNYFLGISVHTRTPVDTEFKLGVDDDSVSDPTLYRSPAGSLQYLTFTRPDISYAVQQVCLHMYDPREPHLSAFKRILWYVHGTLHYGLQLFSSSTTDLSAKRQPTLSRSSAEAEYRGVSNAIAETCWLRNLLRELHTPLSSATLVYCDNAYFQKIESLMTILASLDSPVGDEDVVHYALVGLPNKYDQVCGYMHYKDVFPDLKTARTLLITEKMRLKTKANDLLADSSSPMVFVAESGTCRFRDRCRFIHDPNVKNTPNNSVELNASNMDKLVVKLLGRLGMNTKLDPSIVGPLNDKGTRTQPSPAAY